MLCPFCAEDFNEEALVCKACGRDLRLVRPLLRDNLALVAQIEELQVRVNAARAQLGRIDAPWRFWALHSAVYVVVPVVLLLAAHVVVTVVLDISPIYLRYASLVIPLPFGFSLLWFSHHGVGWSVLAGIAVGLLAVAGMLDATGAPGPIAVTMARLVGRHVGDQALRRRAQKIQDNFGTIATVSGALLAAAGSVYTGLRAIVGGF